MQKQSSPVSIVQSYKSIRDNIISENPHCQVITVSSPSAHDGKTTTAINLAVAFSKLQKKTLIVDADLANGSVERKLRLASRYGLSDLLCNRCDLDLAIIAKDTYTDILSCGSRTQNSEQLLSTDTLENLISGLRLAYDYIIIDTPAICESNDSIFVGKQSDGVVLILRDGRTRHKEIATAIKILEQAKIKLFGTVINASKE